MKNKRLQNIGLHRPWNLSRHLERRKWVSSFANVRRKNTISTTFTNLFVTFLRFDALGRFDDVSGFASLGSQCSWYDSSSTAVEASSPVKSLIWSFTSFPFRNSGGEGTEELSASAPSGVPESSANDDKRHIRVTTMSHPGYPHVPSARNHKLTTQGFHSVPFTVAINILMNKLHSDRHQLTMLCSLEGNVPEVSSVWSYWIAVTLSGGPSVAWYSTIAPCVQHNV